MLQFRTLAIAACLAVFGAALVQAQAQDDEAKEVIRKAITAHGGEKNLAKMNGIISKFKGTIQANGMSLPLTGETILLRPNKIKHSLSLDVAGMQIPVVVVYDGKKLWRSVNNTVEEIKDEKILNETRESVEAEGAASLLDFLKEPYKLASIGEVKVKDKAAIGIRVSKKGQREITYYFDKKSHLLVKTEMRVNDPEAGQEVNQEKYITGYREVDGVKTGSRLVVEKDGKAFMDLEITESKHYEKLDASTFVMP